MNTDKEIQEEVFRRYPDFNTDFETNLRQMDKRDAFEAGVEWVSQQPKQQGSMQWVEKDFLEYIMEARHEFALFISQTKWDVKLRTEVDNILIAYDQMKNILTEAPNPKQLDAGCPFDEKLK